MRLLPFLDEAGDLRQEGFVRNTGLTVNYVINTFMRFISVVQNWEEVDLRAARPRWGSTQWAIFDPSTNTRFKCMANDVPVWVA